MAKAPLDLTSGPIGRNLLLFSLPILAGNIAQSLNGSVNAVWVGRFLGEAALTATANANNIMFFLIGSVFGFGMASTILIGQAIGARDIAQARRVVGTSATFFIGLSVIIAIAGWFMAHPLLAAMGTPAARCHWPRPTCRSSSWRCRRCTRSPSSPPPCAVPVIRARRSAS